MFFSKALAAVALATVVAADAPTCPASSPVSCQTKSTITNTCCTEVQGEVVQVQFWDTNPETGPLTSWTIHGLWPDNCDGTFEQYCDESRQYTNISCILENAGTRGQSILSYMETYWKDVSGGDESFWEHEWGKHGTCYSTLSPSCYSDYTKQEEVVDFFEQTITQFKALPTYDWLSAAGIVPSSTKTYTNAAVSAALAAKHGGAPTLNCDNGALSEIYYTFNVKGSIANGQFIAANPTGESGSCGSSFKYPPKKSGTAPKVSSTKKCSIAAATARAFAA